MRVGGAEIVVEPDLLVVVMNAVDLRVILRCDRLGFHMVK